MDDARRSALGRLTDKDKECLRRRLHPQTAKEMEIDLGVSPHAVEKRLKMARAKLGLSSSLAAARLLAEAESGDRQVPQPAGLPALAIDDDEGAAGRAPRTRSRYGWARGSDLAGVPPMPIPAAFVAATLIALLPQVSAPVPAPSPNAQRNNGFEQAIYRRASPDEVRAFVADSSRTMDKDGSHFIERVEAPESGLIEGPGGRVGDPVPATAPITIIHGRTGQAIWIATFDTDADGRVSEPEFTRIEVPSFLRLGVPSNWRGVKAAAAAETAAQR